MTQIQSTYRLLLAYHEENQRLNSSVLGIYLRSKIREFGNNNNIRLQHLFDDLAKLQEEYFVLEGEGKNTRIKFTTPTEAGAKPMPVMKEGKTQQDFEKEYNKLLDTEITIAI